MLGGVLYKVGCGSRCFGLERGILSACERLRCGVCYGTHVYHYCQEQEKERTVKEQALVTNIEEKLYDIDPIFFEQAIACKNGLMN